MEQVWELKLNFLSVGCICGLRYELCSVLKASFRGDSLCVEVLLSEEEV